MTTAQTASSVRPSPPHRSAGGSSLLFVLWAIMLTSFAVIGLITYLARGMDESIDAEKEFRARLLLQSARVVAAHPAIESGDPLLRQRVSSVSSYEISLTTEGVYLAINQLAVSVPQRQFARRLFEKWGMDSKAAETLVDSIADWIDPDDQPRQYGAERDYYLRLGNPQYPFSQPFTDIDDLAFVRGSEELDRVKPDWRDYFTIYGDGTIDIHRASPEMLEVLFDVTNSEMSRFIGARNGPDGVPDTIDDRRFTTLEEMRGYLDVPPSNYAAVSKLLTLDHPIKRTDCVAWAGGLKRRLTIIKGPGVDILREE